jgi:hypothetical protein
MKKLVTAVGVFCLASFLAGSVMAEPSAKFAAHVNDPGEGLYLLKNGSDTKNQNPDSNQDEATILSSILKTANKKDLLIGVSLQSSIYTDTTVKGKNGSTEQAGATGAIEVMVEIDGHAVYPSQVIFAKRIQELNAVLGGVIETCEVNCVTEIINDAPVTTCDDIVVATDCFVTEEEIGLALTTTSANHFNFVAPNIDSGEHLVEVTARAISSAEFTNGYVQIPIFDQDGNIIGYENGDETADNEASSYALVKLGSLTVEEVRATNSEEFLVMD